LLRREGAHLRGFEAERPSVQPGALSRSPALPRSVERPFGRRLMRPAGQQEKRAGAMGGPATEDQLQDFFQGRAAALGLASACPSQATIEFDILLVWSDSDP